MFGLIVLPVIVSTWRKIDFKKHIGIDTFQDKHFKRDGF